MKLLSVLVDHPAQVMSREDLITKVWGVEYGGDESLSRAISLLRKALGDKRGHYTHIQTISRGGYRLIAELDFTPERSSPNPILAQVDNRSAEGDAHPERFTRPEANPSTPLASTPRRMKREAMRPARLSLRGVAAAAALALSLSAMGVYAASNMAPRAATDVQSASLQSKLTQGYDHIQDFTAPGAIESAQQIFSDILAENLDHAGARAGLAFSMFRQYTHAERDPALLQRASAHAQAALRKDQHLALANIAVGWAAEFNGDFDEAHRYLDRADILQPGAMLAMESRFRTFSKQGEKQQAGDAIDRAIAAYPDQALFYTYRANYKLQDDDVVASEADYRKALSLAPDNPRTYAELSHVLHLQGQTQTAIAIIQQGLKINETALLYNNLGAYLFFQGQYELAASAFEKTLTLSGDSHNYLYWANLGDAYRWSENNTSKAQESYTRALQLLQTDLDRYPNSINLKSRAALFNAKLGNLDAAQNFMDSFTLSDDSPSIQLYRAVVTYEIMSNREKALDCLRAAIAADYPMIEILNDPELSRLRQDPDYHRLLAKL